MLNRRLVLHTVILTVLILVVNTVLLVALAIKPFSEPTSWGLACWTGKWFWGYMQRHWEDDLNAREVLTFSGDEIPQGESAVIISNHLGYSDYYLIQALAKEAGMLGSCRYFVKKELVWKIPIFGWSFWAIGMILVSRNWTSDALAVAESFARIRRNQHAAWIILYPEGTRRTKRKIVQSQAFAREHKKSVLKNLLWPRTKGFVSTVQGLQDSHIKHIYDLTFLYTSSPPDTARVPSLADQLGCADMARAGYAFHVHVQRHTIKELPRDEANLRAWCEEAWRRKDEILEDMLGGATSEKET